MAYYVVAPPVCPQSGCKKLATHEVKTSGSASYGKFCEQHAMAYAKKANKAEGY